MSCSYRGIARIRHDFAGRFDNVLKYASCVSAVLSCHVLISINALKVKRREQISRDFVVLHNVR